MPSLIINADDFGLTPGINRAVEELHQAGVLTSATLMANGPAFADAVAIALRNPGLGVGCHLVFVEGLPVSHPWDIPTLMGADAKTFRPTLLEFAQAAFRGTILPADLVRETQAQIQKLQRAGIDVTHVDTHKHTHAFPAVTRSILLATERCGVPALRNPFEPTWSAEAVPLPFKRRAESWLLSRYQPQFNALTAELRTHGLILDGTLGIAATGTLSPESLHALFAAAALHPGSYELCCHPGYVDAALDSITTRLRASRELEILALKQVIPDILRTHPALELIHYGDLGIAGLQRASGQFVPNTGFEIAL